MKFFGRGTAGLVMLLAGICLVGCQSPSNDLQFNALGVATAPGDPSAPTVSPVAPVAPATPLAQAAPGLPAAVLNDAGAANADGSGIILHINEAIIVSFADTPGLIQPIEDTIKADGSITLIYNQKFQAAGKTVGALQDEIRQRYVPQYFKYLTPSIKIGDRFYNVGGEVRSPSRQAYVTTMTVLRAIDTAGGFTDFARKTHVQLTRAGGGRVITVNCIKALTHPELDLPVYPGDKIYVPKRWF